MVKTFCDRCNSELNNNDYFNVRITKELTKSNLSSDISGKKDFCNKCMSDIMAFFNDKTRQTSRD